MQGKCVIVGMEQYTSKKTGDVYAKVLLVDEGSTDTVTVLTKDFTIMQQAFYTSIKCVFDYNEKYKQLSLLGYEPVTMGK